MAKLIDLAGQRFNRLTVIKRAENKIKGRGAYWLCQCDCGRKVVVRGSALKTSTKSCGCLHSEMSRQRVLKRSKHNMAYTRLYKIWVGIKTRCYNIKCKIYKYYGGKGIQICEEWKNDFLAFYNWAILNGYDDSLSIDRIDNNDDYNPSNCRWSTDIEQANNKTDNRYIKIGSESHTLSEWCKIKNISRTAVYKRMQNGMSAEEALNKNKRKYTIKERKEEKKCIVRIN